MNQPFRPSRRWVALVAAATLAATLSGCGSTAPGSTPGAGSKAQAATGPDSAQSVVNRLLQPVPSYSLPAERLSGVSTLAGKTIYYIPITQQAPAFAVTGAALRSALDTVGLKLQICNGNANPSQISACVGQATGANAAAIVLDAIPYALASNALDAARAKKIPVLTTNQVPDTAHPADQTLGYIEGGGHAMLKALADWITVDSGGTAKVVLNQATDSPSSISYAEDAQQRLAQQCPGCSMAMNKISTSNFSLIPSATSSAILRTPGVGYVVSEFEVYLQPTLGGVQQSGRISSVRGGTTAATLGGLRMLSAKNFLFVDVGKSLTFNGWVDADAVLRLLLGKSLPEYDIPVRLFTRDNVATLSLTPEAEASGEWYGPTDFAAEFKGLWGLAG